MIERDSNHYQIVLKRNKRTFVEYTTRQLLLLYRASEWRDGSFYPILWVGPHTHSIKISILLTMPLLIRSVFQKFSFTPSPGSLPSTSFPTTLSISMDIRTNTPYPTPTSPYPSFKISRYQASFWFCFFKNQLTTKHIIVPSRRKWQGREGKWGGRGGIVRWERIFSDL